MVRWADRERHPNRRCLRHLAPPNLGLETCPGTGVGRRPAHTTAADMPSARNPAGHTQVVRTRCCCNQPVWVRGRREFDRHRPRARSASHAHLRRRHRHRQSHDRQLLHCQVARHRGLIRRHYRDPEAVECCCSLIMLLSCVSSMRVRVGNGTDSRRVRQRQLRQDSGFGVRGW